MWQTRKRVTPESLCITLYIPQPTLISGMTLAEVWPSGAAGEQRKDVLGSLDLTKGLKLKVNIIKVGIHAYWAECSSPFH